MAQSPNKSENVLKVIRTAQSLFIENGVAATSINRIAKEAGLTSMSVYRYFGSKDALVIAAWKDALSIFYEGFMSRYMERTAHMTNGYQRFVACMDEYTNTYTRVPKWYTYTREMLSCGLATDSAADMNSIFWQFCGTEIPIPALISLEEGVKDGSIKPDININMIFQIILNAYTGANIYKDSSLSLDPVETLKLSSEIIANYIKNDT